MKLPGYDNISRRQSVLADTYGQEGKSHKYIRKSSWLHPPITNHSYLVTTHLPTAYLLTYTARMTEDLQRPPPDWWGRQQPRVIKPRRRVRLSVRSSACDDDGDDGISERLKEAYNTTRRFTVVGRTVWTTTRSIGEPSSEIRPGYILFSVL